MERWPEEGVAKDYVIVGGGLAGGLIALALANAGRGGRVTLIDREPRLGGNHTWSFHLTDLNADEWGLVAPLVATQALAEGRPVLGIAANLDQYLAMTAIQDAGAGLLLRAGTLERKTLSQALSRACEPAYAHAANRLRDELGQWNAPATFAAFVDEVTA